MPRNPVNPDATELTRLIKGKADPSDIKRERRRLGPEPDNHHNALTCPYCVPSRKFRDILAKYTITEIIAAIQFMETMDGSTE